MTVADKLAALAAAKAEIVRAVQDRGGVLAGDPPIADIAPAIDALPEGGASDIIGVRTTGIYIDLDARVIDVAGAPGTIRTYFAFSSGVEELRGTENVTRIAAYAFYRCAELTTVAFPKITNIATKAFYDCSKLEIFIAGTEADQVCTLEHADAFKNTPLTMRIVVPDALVEDYKTATNWATYASRIIGVTEWEATK